MIFSVGPGILLQYLKDQRVYHGCHLLLQGVWSCKECRSCPGTGRAVTTLSILGGQDKNISSSFLIFLYFLVIFSSISFHFLPHFGLPGGWLSHPERPWLRHWELALRSRMKQEIGNVKTIFQSLFSRLTE